MNGYVHDPRHRFSYELRPSARLDAALRTIAATLETRGLLLPGASTAPRFQPHLTLLRASSASADALDAAARVVRAAPEVLLDRAGSFGEGRIVYMQMRARALVDAARARVIDALDSDLLDPLVHARPWAPHVTIAYAVPREHRVEALAFVERQLPLRGAWGAIQCWDLDVRPTRLVSQALLDAPR